MYATCISCFYCLLKFLKRQDLLNVLARMMRPACDQVVRFHFFFSLRCILLQIHFLTSRVCGLVFVVILFWVFFFFLQQVKVTLNDEDMDTFVFAVGTKKAMARLQKEMQDLVSFFLKLDMQF